jgi:hypothetical protein
MDLILQAHKSISSIFNSAPLFVVEGDDIKTALDELEIDNVQLFADGSLSASMDRVTNDVVFVISDRDISDNSMLSRLLDGKNILQIPTHAFDGSLETTLYTLRMCSSLDLEDCVARNNAVLAEIASDRKDFSLESARSSVRFSLYDEVRIMETAQEQYLTDGSEMALSTYTEVAFIPNILDARTVQPALLGYNVSGTFQCDCCLVAIHMEIDAEIVDRHQKLMDVIDGLHERGEFPLSIELLDAQVKSIKTRSGIDVSSAFLGHMHGHLAENILELAVGTNAGANRDTLTWRYNSPINESALGFHVAIGDGRLCPHVDFICACPDAYDSFFRERAT